MAPVSVRSHDQRGTLGNQVAMWLVSLPVDEPDPLQRLEAVKAVTEHLKKTDQALGASTLVRLSAGAPATLVSLASRLAAGVRPFNMTVTNVPGPQFPLYLLGSRMVGSYPLVPLWQAHGVGVALFSYAGTVYWGLNADYDIVPDVDEFADALRQSLAELSAAAGAAPTTPASTRRPKKRPPLGKISPSEPTADEKAAAKSETRKSAGVKKAAGTKSAGAKKAAGTKSAATRKAAGAK